MLGQYGCDDLGHLVESSDAPGTVRVDRVFEDAGADGRAVYRARTFRVPVARCDNRADKTSFLRAPKTEWPKAAVDALHAELRQAFAVLSRGRNP